MFHAVFQQPIAAAAAPASQSVLRKRKAADVESILNSNARLRNSLAANTEPCSPDDNGKSKAKAARDASSPNESKRRKSSGAGCTGHENTAPSVDAGQQGSIGYVPLVTSFFSNVLSFFSFVGGASESSAVPSAEPAAAAPAAKCTRTVVQTKAFAKTPGDLLYETPAR
jgi:hypothetical protein